MEISYDEINYFYNNKIHTGERLWDINRVKDAVKLNKITEEQFRQITGEDYVA